MLLERPQEDKSETAGMGLARSDASNAGCTSATTCRCSGLSFCLQQSNALQLSYLKQVELIFVPNDGVAQEQHSLSSTDSNSGLARGAAGNADHFFRVVTRVALPKQVMSLMISTLSSTQ